MKRLLFLLFFTTSLAWGGGQFKSGSYKLTPYYQSHFYEGQGTKAKSVGNGGVIGTLTNSPIWVKGRYYYGLQFTANSACLSVPGSASVAGGAAITFSAWFKMAPGQSTLQTGQGILFVQQNAGPANFFYYYITGQGGIGNVNYVSNLLYNDMKVSTESWNFFYFNMSGTGATNMITTCLITKGIKICHNEVLNVSQGNGFLEIGGQSIANNPCNCVMDDVQLFAGNDNMGAVWNSYWQGIAAGKE